MKYPPSFFRNDLPEWKRKKDDMLCQVFYRPISFVASALFCEIGWSANAVSYFSILMALASCVAFLFSHPILGAVFVNIWLLLDCADGNIARSVKRERFGDFADSMSSYICVGYMFVCMGYCVYEMGGILVNPGQPLIIVIGALAGSSDSLMRLIYQKFVNSAHALGMDARVQENPADESTINRIRIKVDAYLSVGGLLPAFVLLASAFHALDLIVLCWAAYYVAAFVATAVYLIRKTIQMNRGGNGLDS